MYNIYELYKVEYYLEEYIFKYFFYLKSNFMHYLEDKVNFYNELIWDYLRYREVQLRNRRANDF